MPTTAKKRPKAATAPKDWTNAITQFLDWMQDNEKAQATIKNYREDLLFFTEWYQKTYDERPVLALLQPEELRAARAMRGTSSTSRPPSTASSPRCGCSSDGPRIRDTHPRSGRPSKSPGSRLPPRWLAPKEAAARSSVRPGTTPGIATSAFS